ncbi:MAG TPA: hypothetical protein DDX39_08705 [Bacteroidales bacterium]|nr:MAG: hypothetical protein A2W98_04720 [Bacteroidetes bacterium GWF2_33_38]OFY72276.1 MAG: hypothetical protein A2265_05830 [Bacteroidetes bacterium RIFOXYA12_FULL_33_9]HBF88706.1 hypothetical protein [Bacteroidales bacterium]
MASPSLIVVCKTIIYFRSICYCFETLLEKKTPNLQGFKNLGGFFPICDTFSKSFRTFGKIKNLGYEMPNKIE